MIDKERREKVRLLEIGSWGSEDAVEIKSLGKRRIVFIHR